MQYAINNVETTTHEMQMKRSKLIREFYRNVEQRFTILVEREFLFTLSRRIIDELQKFIAVNAEFVHCLVRRDQEIGRFV